MGGQTLRFAAFGWHDVDIGISVVLAREGNRLPIW
jgi:hypothetical protein